MRKGEFPECLKTSRVIPIQKPGKSSNSLESFRPINNLNPVEKIVEEAIKIQLQNITGEEIGIPCALLGSQETEKRNFENKCWSAI